MINIRQIYVHLSLAWKRSFGKRRILKETILKNRLRKRGTKGGYYFCLKKAFEWISLFEYSETKSLLELSVAYGGEKIVHAIR
jgi:hypothetical protein